MKGKRMLFVVMTMLFAAAGILSPALAQERYFQPSKIIVKPTFKIDVWVDKDSILFYEGMKFVQFVSRVKWDCIVSFG